ncbi:MAG: aminopeptidase [Candidatus Neomarinimicrobiota bacterium]
MGHVALGEVKLLAGRKPVEEVLRESQLSHQEQLKIQLIIDVKSFAVDHLGLDGGDSYSSYVNIDGPYVSYALSAAPKDALESYLWHFPIIGELPYKGFFRKDYALRREKRLARKGYDTYLRGISAFSTLGYFDDPIVSCMLRYDDSDLVETVIHELLHRTVWVKGNVNFNENLANFVAEKGTLAYLVRRYGESSPESRHYRDVLADTRLFEKQIEVLTTQLETMYGESISREEKVRRREEFFEQAKADYAPILLQMKTERYKGFFERHTMNNALLLSYRRYHRDTSFFEKALEGDGADLSRMIVALQNLSPEEIPVTFRDP